MTNNPAGRLRAVMDEARRSTPGEAQAVAWNKLLRTGDEPELQAGVVVERLGHLMSLPQAIRNAVSSIPDIDGGVYVGRLTAWDEAFSRRIEFAQPWQHFIGGFNDADTYCLLACDELLTRLRPEPTLPDEYPSSIIGELEELQAAVGSADLDEDVRQFLLEGLNRMITALREYHLLGIRPVMHALESALAAHALQPDVVERSRASEVGSAFWRSFGGIYARVEGLKPSYRALQGAALDLLGLPSGPA